jgi:hypothetical protein
MLLGYIADDFTGASDIANTLAPGRAQDGTNGMPTMFLHSAGSPAGQMHASQHKVAVLGSEHRAQVTVPEARVSSAFQKSIILPAIVMLRADPTTGCSTQQRSFAPRRTYSRPKASRRR